MICKCDDCSKVYDDFYRSKLCPHGKFDISPSAREATRDYSTTHPDFEPLDDGVGTWLSGFWEQSIRRGRG